MFQKALDAAYDRMTWVERQNAQRAKRENWLVIGRGPGYPGGPELVRVQYPQTWRDRTPHERQNIPGTMATHDFLAADYDS